MTPGCLTRPHTPHCEDPCPAPAPPTTDRRRRAGRGVRRRRSPARPGRCPRYPPAGTAHALAHVRGIKDTSRQGRWHNTKFKALAEELGIEVSKDPRIGWSPTRCRRPRARPTPTLWAVSPVRCGCSVPSSCRPGPARVSRVRRRRACVSAVAVSAWRHRCSPQARSSAEYARPRSCPSPTSTSPSGSAARRPGSGRRAQHARAAGDLHACSIDRLCGFAHPTDPTELGDWSRRQRWRCEPWEVVR